MSLDRMQQIIDFSVELEKLKGVERRIKPKGQSRFENSAEHSWQVTLLALLMVDELFQHTDEKPDTLKVVKMLLLHDIVEIDAGDKMVYDNNHDDFDNELVAAKRIFGLLPPDVRDECLSIWVEFEERETLEARVAKAMDRAIPIIQNLNNNGQSWVENGISVHQVIEKNSIIADGFPPLWNWLLIKLEYAVQQGWLKS